MDCPVTGFTEQQIYERLSLEMSAANSQTGSYTVAINAEKIYRYNKDRDVQTLIEKSGLCYVDGAAAVFGIKLLYGKNYNKINFPEILLEYCAQNQTRLFIAGSKNSTVCTAVKNIRDKYKNINIVGFCDGFLGFDDIEQLIREEQPQVVLLALGSPKQEKFARLLVERGHCILFCGAGGAIDIMAGEKSRAPQWMIDGYLEWLYRLYKEPHRIIRMSALPKVLAALLIYKLTRSNILKLVK